MFLAFVFNINIFLMLLMKKTVFVTLVLLLTKSTIVNTWLNALDIREAKTTGTYA
jgi:hypothetical protein